MAATTEQQTVMLEEVTLQGNEEIVTVAEGNVVEGEDVSEDILQQALVEATDGFDQSEVTYTTETSTVVSDGTMPVKVGTVLGNETYTVVGSVDESNNFVPSEPQPGTSLLKPNVLQQHAVTNVVQTTSQETPASATVTVTSNNADNIPLGSSANPIRIVQQGNQYTSLQQLTPDQLSQIMQVVQEQQVSKVTSEGGGSSTIFNPQTQTRIVYRVIYPSELHKNKIAGEEVKNHVVIGADGQPLTIQQTFGKRTYRKRNREEEDKVDGPELSKEEKEERKKKRPRTRSGRVSRPPKHMVKDYKHIHPLDWDEDYDDSDGGYSDFKQSDEDGEGSEHPRKKDFVYVQPGGSTLKKKNWKCETCSKAYIGKAGLSRHYSLNPSHGHLEDEQPPDDKLRNTARQNGDISEDSNTQDSTSPQSSASLTSLTNSQSVTSTVTSTSNTPTQVSTASPRIPKGALKMKQSYLQENTPTRRRARLKDFVRQCEDEELMEIVLPRLAKVITVWEFLLMKVEKGKPLKPHFTDVFKEFEALHKKVKKMCGEHLKPATDASQNNKFQLTDESMASSLGLKVGAYDILQTPQEEPPEQRQYKLLTTGHGQLIGETQFTKRTVQVVSPNQLVAVSPIKKPNIEITPMVSVSQENRQLAPSVSVQESVTPVATQIATTVATPIENGVNQKQSNPTPIIVTNGNANPNPPQQNLLTNGNGFVPLKDEALEMQNSKQNTIVINTKPTEEMNSTGVEKAESQQETHIETQGTQVIQQVEGQVMHEINGDTHVYVQEGDVAEIMTSEQHMEQVGEETQTLYQSTNGIYLIQNPDGTFQVHGNSDQTIPLETVQALLANAMDADTQLQIEQTEEINQS